VTKTSNFRSISGHRKKMKRYWLRIKTSDGSTHSVHSFRQQFYAIIPKSLEETLLITVHRTARYTKPGLPRKRERPTRGGGSGASPPKHSFVSDARTGTGHSLNVDGQGLIQGVHSLIRQPLLDRGPQRRRPRSRQTLAHSPRRESESDAVADGVVTVTSALPPPSGAS
jgi:hypothetical protein